MTQERHLSTAGPVAVLRAAAAGHDDCRVDHLHFDRQARVWRRPAALVPGAITLMLTGTPLQPDGVSR